MRVFSAHAEVVPPKVIQKQKIFSILRARGGSSTTEAWKKWFDLYSPRTRR